MAGAPQRLSEPTTEFGVLDPVIEAKVRDSIGRQSMLTTLGIEIDAVDAGRVALLLTHRGDLLQQHGFVHAGAISTAADSAGGYASLTLAPVDFDVLTIDFTINLVSPALQPRFLAVGTVVRAGRTVTVAHTDVFGLADDGSREIVAVMQSTLLTRPMPPGRTG